MALPTFNIYTHVLMPHPTDSFLSHLGIYKPSCQLSSLYLQARRKVARLGFDWLLSWVELLAWSYRANSRHTWLRCYLPIIAAWKRMWNLVKVFNANRTNRREGRLADLTTWQSPAWQRCLCSFSYTENRHHWGVMLILYNAHIKW